MIIKKDVIVGTTQNFSGSVCFVFVCLFFYISVSVDSFWDTPSGVKSSQIDKLCCELKKIKARYYRSVNIKFVPCLIKSFRIL